MYNHLHTCFIFTFSLRGRKHKVSLDRGAGSDTEHPSADETALKEEGLLSGMSSARKLQ